MSPSRRLSQLKTLQVIQEQYLAAIASAPDSERDVPHMQLYERLHVGIGTLAEKVNALERAEPEDVALVVHVWPLWPMLGCDARVVE